MGLKQVKEWKVVYIPLGTTAGLYHTNVQYFRLKLTPERRCQKVLKQSTKHYALGIMEHQGDSKIKLKSLVKQSNSEKKRKNPKTII